MLQAAQACDTCRDRKKRCDRALPECSDCQRRQVRCQYSQDVEERGMVESLWQKLKALERCNRVTEDATTASPQHILPIPRLQREIHYEVTYPVSKRWYFPMLLHFRFHSMVPSIRDLDPGSAAYKLRTAWVAGYLSDPAMFHGILYAASANLDLINGEHDNPVTHFHRAEAIRLVNATLSQLESHENLPFTVLATTWALGHVARLNGCTSEAHIHEIGLAKMVRCRDQNVGSGFNGALSFLIMLSDIWNAVINEEDTLLDFIDERQSPYSAQPRRTLISTALQCAPKEGVISNDVISLLHIINKSSMKRRETLCIDNTISFPAPTASGQSSFDSFQCQLPPDYQYILMLLQVERLASSQRQDYISECCCLAAIIYWRVLSTNLPFLSPDNEAIANQLFASLQHSDSIRWMEMAPEMHIWVSYVGALASGNRAQRASFVARSKTSVVVLSPDRLLHFQDGVSHILCLSRYLRSRAC